MSLDPNDEGLIAQLVRTSQIINAALIAGVVAFLAVAVFIRASGKDGIIGKDPYGLAEPIVLVGLVLAMTNTALSQVMPGFMVANTRRAIRSGTWQPPVGTSGQKLTAPTTDSVRLMPMYQTQRIVRLALLEGAAFFGLIGFMIYGNVIVLLAALALLVGMVIGFPTRATVEAWLDHQLELLRTE